MRYPKECSMRLLLKQIEEINNLTERYLGNNSKAFLFGSRLNDSGRGGDVDLLVETPAPAPRVARARLKAELEQNLNLPVDLVVVNKQQPLSTFQRMVRSQAIPLPKSNNA